MIIIYIALIILAVAMLAQAVAIWHLRNKIDDLEEFANAVSVMIVNSANKKIKTINKDDFEKLIKEKLSKENNNNDDEEGD